MSTGFENENEIISEFVNKMNYRDLNDNLKSINNNCSVCRDNFGDGEDIEVRILSCNHVFCRI